MADLAAAAALYEAELVRVLGEPPRLDHCLLGMGPDGHVCSLFPGHPLLAEAVRRVAAVEDSLKPPPRRLTLTLPVLHQAAELCVAAFGRAKAAAIAAALEDDSSRLPVALALRGARRAVVMLDREAASGLTSRV
jgi:6-phosphogluconolactonase